MIETNNEYEFFKFPKQLAKQKILKSLKSQEETSFTPNMKLIYLYLLDRFTFFKSSGSEYFDTNKTIADALAIEEKTVGRCLIKLSEFGIIDKKIIKFRNLPKNVYTDVKDLCHVVSVSAEDTTQIPKQPQVAVAPVDFEFDNDFPF